MIKTYMETASKAYYEGTPIISNEEYDALEAIHGQVISGTGDIPHAYRMYSLNKHYDKDGAYPLDTSKCVETPKLDGAAVSLLYVDGSFVHMLTRGNGVVGRDITWKAHYLGIPTNIELGGVVQITGEVVAVKTVENSRNYASGALNLKETTEFSAKVEEGNMRFVAYNIQIEPDKWGSQETYPKDLESLEEQGFATIQSEDWSLYPQDGIVFRLTNYYAFNQAGFTDRFPKGAFAHKEDQEVFTTTLLDVVWQCGGSGKVTPVGILEPIMIGEANVSRATLNNIAYIEALDLEIGCEVEVIRAGEIIPKIVGRV